MKKITSGFVFAVILAFASPALAERLVAEVNKTTQTVTIKLDDEILYNWQVSTGKKGMDTPIGYFNGQRKYTMWRSHKYEDSPMPYTVFFYGGYAVHGTYDVKHLGTRASHGCVRLTIENAKTFYDLVSEVGLKQTLVIIGQ